MLSLRLTLLVAAAAIASDAPPPLKVIRATPEGSADPGAVVAVTFDRPVAGSLDRAVDPEAVLELVPQVPGTFEGRDPVTVRQHARRAVPVFFPREWTAGARRLAGRARPCRAIPRARRALHDGAERAGRLGAPRPAHLSGDESRVPLARRDRAPARISVADSVRCPLRAPRGGRVAARSLGGPAPPDRDPGSGPPAALRLRGRPRHPVRPRRRAARRAGTLVDRDLRSVPARRGGVLERGVLPHRPVLAPVHHARKRRRADAAPLDPSQGGPLRRRYRGSATE